MFRKLFNDAIEFDIYAIPVTLRIGGKEHTSSSYSSFITKITFIILLGKCFNFPLFSKNLII